ncbi:Glycosyltransferase family 2 protein [Desulfovibrionales bacterium]
MFLKDCLSDMHHLPPVTTYVSPKQEAPVLLIVFNRPKTTARILEAIRAARPRRLFVAADAPRNGFNTPPDEVERCRQVRAIISTVDWNCQLATRFAETNLGCQYGPATALSWFFDQVEAGIVLEDDCLPHPDFFPFCNELLARYYHDPRVTIIAGQCYRTTSPPGGYSYGFSRFPLTWGWASFARTWRLYDPNMVRWPEARSAGLLESYFHRPTAIQYWRSILDRVYDGRIQNAWDYKLLLACWLARGLTAYPARNLVVNIGFGELATHTGEKNPLAPDRLEPLSFPLRHPPYLLRDHTLDDLLQCRYYQHSFPDRCRAHLRRILTRWHG